MFTSLSALAIPLGGLFGMAYWLVPRWLEREVRHTVLAAGGGILVGTVAFALDPHGAELVPRPWIVVFIGAGAVAFCGLDIMMQRSGKGGAQLAAMLADFFPDTLALGASFAAGDGRRRILALLIAAQNLSRGV